MGEQTGAIEPWRPTAPSDGTLEDVTLSEWIGQAIGAASMCWSEAPTGVFDSTHAARIADALHEHVQQVIDGVIAGTIRATKGE
jgi:hypothetical protein